MKFPLLLLALTALLLWCAFAFNDLEATPPIVRPAPPRSTIVPPARPALSVSDASNMDASSPPLFRPAVTPAALSAPQPGDAFTLVGLAGNGEARVALLRDRADHQVFNVHAGDTVRDWNVLEANERCVVLRKARRRQNVCLS